jgi:hypothetical protein
MIVDTLTKSSHFDPVHKTHQAPDVASLYQRDIETTRRTKGSYLIEDRCLQDNFGRFFQKALGTPLNLSATRP